MYKILRHKYGQVIFSEYITTFFMVVAIVIAMGTLVKRSIQGRMFAAHGSVFQDVNAVFSDPAMNFQGNIWAQYEPYYIVNAESLKNYRQQHDGRILPGGRDGIVEYRDNNDIRSRAHRAQPPPAWTD